MRAIMRLMAASKGAKVTLPSDVAMMPPIHLYRRIKKAHRTYLYEDQRSVGDEYVRSEFERMKDVDNPIHIVGFLSRWQEYLQHLEGDDWKGKKLEVSVLEKLSEQQIEQVCKRRLPYFIYFFICKRTQKETKKCDYKKY